MSRFSSVDPLNEISCYVNTFIVDFLKGNEVMLDYLFVDNLFQLSVLIELDFIIISKQFIVSCLPKFTLIIKLYYKQNDLNKLPKLKSLLSEWI